MLKRSTNRLGSITRGAGPAFGGGASSGSITAGPLQKSPPRLGGVSPKAPPRLGPGVGRGRGPVYGGGGPRGRIGAPRPIGSMPPRSGPPYGRPPLGRIPRQPGGPPVYGRPVPDDPPMYGRPVPDGPDVPTPWVGRQPDVPPPDFWASDDRDQMLMRVIRAMSRGGGWQ